MSGTFLSWMLSLTESEMFIRLEMLFERCVYARVYIYKHICARAPVFIYIYIYIYIYI